MSVDSCISIAFSLDSLGPGASIPEQIRHPSTSDTEDRQHHLLSPPPLDEDSYPSTLQTTLRQPRDGSLTGSQDTVQLGDRFDSNASLSTEGRDSEASSSGPSRTEFTEASLVGSEPMLENLLTPAELVLSAGSCVASTGTSHILPNENTRLSPGSQNAEPSFSWSAAVDPRSQSPQLWARTSSDSMKRREDTERESVTSSPMADRPSAPTSSRGREDGSVGRGAASASVLSESVQRTEPEGCSAAPPDNPVPPGPTAPSGPGPQQLPPAADTEEEEEEEEAAVEGPGAPPLLKEEDDQGVVSDGGSSSSLARKVTELLQSQSAASVVSSTSSTTDQEERRARGTPSDICGTIELLSHVKGQNKPLILWGESHVCPQFS